jgi:two-component system, OmpR family, aerobic respiration control sensor histidine kinase ArcB
MAQQNTYRFLLVEDDKICQRIVKMLLLSFGVKADIAETGAQALELSSTNKYDLIFLDLGLPDIMGDKVAIAIKQKININTKTPIIILTAHKNDEERKKVLQIGVEEFMTKPLTKDKLDGILRRYGLG